MTVITTMNAKTICFVDLTIVQLLFFMNKMSALVTVTLARKVIGFVMIKTTTVDVNGMEETLSLIHI